MSYGEVYGRRGTESYPAVPFQTESGPQTGLQVGAGVKRSHLNGLHLYWECFSWFIQGYVAPIYRGCN